MLSFQPLLRPLLSGILAALLLALIMVTVTIDFRYILLIGTIVFAVAGLLNTRLSDRAVVVALLITAPFATLFALLVLPELPGLFYFPPLYGVASWLGVRYSLRRRQVLGAGIALLILTAGLARYRVPNDVADSLVETKSEPLPAFELSEMSGDTLFREELAGRVVVLDFFGTWCAPCRLELEELETVQAAFAEREDVVFLIVDADLGGDTPEKFAAYIDRTDYPFHYAYDHGGQLFRAVTGPGVGLPALLVIDRRQQIRWQHVGYNAAEMNFARDLTRLITDLLAE